MGNYDNENHVLPAPSGLDAIKLHSILDGFYESSSSSSSSSYSSDEMSNAEEEEADEGINEDGQVFTPRGAVSFRLSPDIYPISARCSTLSQFPESMQLPEDGFQDL